MLLINFLSTKIIILNKSLTGVNCSLKLSKHILAYFYDYRNGSVKTRQGMFGARVDPARGVLIVDLPSDSVWDAKGFMGKGIFHMNDVWFFAGNLRANAEHRVRLWKKEYKK